MRQENPFRCYFQNKNYYQLKNIEKSALSLHNVWFYKTHIMHLYKLYARFLSKTQCIAKIVIIVIVSHC